jgi:hypothetical protein
MGLESVELVMAVEEEFGINIAGEDAANLTTPRLLAGYVVSRLGALQMGHLIMYYSGLSRLRPSSLASPLRKLSPIIISSKTWGVAKLSVMKWRL